MIKYQSHYYNKIILLDSTKLDELAGILLKHCSCVNYGCITKKNATITFDSVDELKQYNNYGDDSIASLRIKACDRSGDTTIDIEFNPSFPYERYSASCSYRFSNTDSETLFVSEFEHFLKKSTESQYAYFGGKVLCVLLWLAMGTLFYFVLIKNAWRPKTLFSSIMQIALSYIIAAGWYYWFDWILRKLFPKVTYSIGEGEKKYNKLKKLRSNLFWTVLVGAIVSLLISVFMRLF